MHKWTTGLVTTAVVAAGIPALATAGGSHAHHCKLDLTARVSRVHTFSGQPPVSGHDLQAGTVDGKICDKAFRGAMREENRYPQWPDFTARVATFGPVGSFRSTGNGSAVINSDSTLTLTGQMAIAGGTGVYKGSSGHIKFTAHVKNSVATFHYKGTIDY